jgi:histidine triad (HIT) family protein
MYSHAPLGYVCPICLVVQGIENEQTMARQADIVLQDDLVLAYVNSKFIESNPGHVIVVPKRHFESLYYLPPAYAHRIMDISQKVAFALKAVRRCDGIWVEQNNEPASGQHAFHYHMHIVPRFDGDNLKQILADGKTRVADPAERIPFAEALRGYFETIV